MNEQSTAVATRDEAHEQSAIGRELAKIREQGLSAVARQKELNRVANMLEGCEWGNVSGRSLSPYTRYAIARICDHYAADPLLHIYVLGGKPYLNGDYYAQEVNSLPDLKGWRQENIGMPYATKMRALAEQTLADAEKFDDPDLKDEARRYAAEARRADERRAHFGIPDKAEEAYETIIEFVAGRETVREANYAPHDNDPVGKARPAETARTRSLRRAGVKASRRLQSLEEKAIAQAIDAEFEIVQDDQRREQAALPSPDGPQAVGTGAGEPEAASTAGAQPLPVKGEVGGPGVTEEPLAHPADFDAEDARKRYFATLRDAGIEGTGRKAWQAANDITGSVTEWGPGEFDRAMEALVGPTRDLALKRAEDLGVDVEDVSLRVLEKRTPDLLKEWRAVLAALEVMAPAQEEEGAPDAATNAQLDL